MVSVVPLGLIEEAVEGFGEVGELVAAGAVVGSPSQRLQWERVKVLTL